ncbi:hypothetical protein BH09VER1_BH09VER1_18850 [soil metagenome]
MKLFQKIGRVLKPKSVPAPYFRAQCRKQTRNANTDPKRTILMSHYGHAGTVYNSSLIARAFQEKGFTPRSFHFESPPSAPLNGLYESFGAKLALSDDSSRGYRKSAVAWATKSAAGLRSKQDLHDLQIDGVEIGHLVYDSYLRYRNQVTVDLKNEWLLACLQSAAEIFWTCAAYFDQHDVAAVIPDHFVYNRCGIISQLAWQRDIPLLFSRFSRPFYIFRLPSRERSPSHLEVPYQHPFDRYPELFSNLLPERQEAACRRAKQAFESHLSGKRTDMIFGGYSAYQEKSGATLFKNNSRPRILVLLHDFCDAPHVFGNWIFPDFFEWIHHLLEKARDTAFQWIVKPHPNLQSHGQDARGLANRQVIEELKKSYPEVLFLDPATSNRQIIQEGISAMFTGYGSAGHEFAYFGLPVVNAAPNPHMRYNFNLHPKSVEEYDEYILRADRLDLSPSRDSIEEFYYMYNYFLPETLGAPFEILPPEILNSPERMASLDQFHSLDDCARAETPALRSQFAEYLDQSLAGIPAVSLPQVQAP